LPSTLLLPSHDLVWAIVCSYIIDPVGRNPLIGVRRWGRWLEVPIFVIVQVSRVTFAAWSGFCLVGAGMSRLEKVSVGYALCRSIEKGGLGL
jgi:hypothetical protein